MFTSESGEKCAVTPFCFVSFPCDLILNFLDLFLGDLTDAEITLKNPLINYTCFMYDRRRIEFPGFAYYAVVLKVVIFHYPPFFGVFTQSQN